MKREELLNRLAAILGPTGVKWDLGGTNILTLSDVLPAEALNALKALITYTGDDINVVVDASGWGTEPMPEPVQHFPYGRAIHEGISVMISQRAKGANKYPTPVEDAGLTADELCVHAQQEMADGLVYTSLLREQIKAEIARGIEITAAQVLAVVDDESKSMEMRLAIIREFCTLRVKTQRAMTMYVQQSELEKFNATGANLLTISRTYMPLVFKTPILVIA